MKLRYLLRSERRALINRLASGVEWGVITDSEAWDSFHREVPLLFACFVRDGSREMNYAAWTAAGLSLRNGTNKQLRAMMTEAGYTLTEDGRWVR